jgi:hypothetical protein
MVTVRFVPTLTLRYVEQLDRLPLVGSMDSARKLFLHLAEASRKMETEPRFYNTLTSNCTNELAKVANTAQPGSIPLNIALIFPGYSDNVLYDLGFIPNDAPLEVVRQKHAITGGCRGECRAAGLFRSAANAPPGSGLTAGGVNRPQH